MPETSPPPPPPPPPPLLHFRTSTNRHTVQVPATYKAAACSTSPEWTQECGSKAVRGLREVSGEGRGVRGYHYGLGGTRSCKVREVGSLQTISSSAPPSPPSPSTTTTNLPINLMELVFRQSELNAWHVRSNDR